MLDNHIVTLYLAEPDVTIEVYFGRARRPLRADAFTDTELYKVLERRPTAAAFRRMVLRGDLEEFDFG